MNIETEDSLSPLIPRFVLWGGLILLLTYGKILWPLMFGYMREENASFIEALSQHHLHGMAFVGLVGAIVIGYFWARARYASNGH